LSITHPFAVLKIINTLLACIMYTPSVYSEPGSDSNFKNLKTK